jgi:hypothetical protein
MAFPTLPSDDPVVVIIQPVSEFGARGTYYAFVYNTLLLGPTDTPYIDTAVRLLTMGFDPARLLFMRRRGVSVNQLSYTIGEAAVLEVEDQSNPPFLYPLGQDGPGTVP